MRRQVATLSSDDIYRPSRPELRRWRRQNPGVTKDEGLQMFAAAGFVEWLMANEDMTQAAAEEFVMAIALICNEGLTESEARRRFRAERSASLVA